QAARTRRIEGFEKLAAGRVSFRLQPGGGEQEPHRLANLLVVVDDENGRLLLRIARHVRIPVEASLPGRKSYYHSASRPINCRRATARGRPEGSSGTCNRRGCIAVRAPGRAAAGRRPGR